MASEVLLSVIICSSCRSITSSCLVVVASSALILVDSVCYSNTYTIEYGFGPHVNVQANGANARVAVQPAPTECYFYRHRQTRTQYKMLHVFIDCVVRM